MEIQLQGQKSENRDTNVTTEEQIQDNVDIQQQQITQRIGTTQNESIQNEQQEQINLIERDKKNNQKEKKTVKKDEKTKKKEPKKKIPKSKLLERSMKYAKQEWKLIVLLNIIQIIPIYLSFKKPFIESAFLDAAGQKDYEKFYDNMSEYLLINIILIIQNPVQTYLNFMVDQKMAINMKRDMFKHVINQDFQFFETYNSGELVNLFGKNLNQVKRQATGQGIMNPVKNISKSVSNVWALYNMSSQITFMFMGLIPFYMITDYIFKKIYFNIEKKEEEEKSKRANITNEVMQNIMTVKSFGNEVREIKEYENHLQQAFLKAKKKSLYTSLESTIHKVIEVCKPIILFSTSLDIIFDQKIQELEQQQQQQGLGKKNKKSMTAGNLSTFIRYSSSLLTLYNSIKQLKVQFGMKNQEASMEKIYEVMDYKSQMKDEGEEELEVNEGNIEFKNVEYFYPSAEDVKVLKNINLFIPKGSYVAFVGMSGAGKTTIVKLLQRFYDVKAGVIQIGSHNIKDIKLTQLRQQIGFVSQHIQLFNSSIEKNITYGVQGDYTQEQLVKVCQMSGCYDFIQDKNLFPKGFETNVGEKGTKLSGGQLQRIGIARALMKNPKILIFDEATSALDAEKEYEVQQNIENLVKNSNHAITIIVIAHRLSTIVNCEEIFVLKYGEIVEKGNHQTLVSNKTGIYSELIKRQITNQDTQQQQDSQQQQQNQQNLIESVKQ